MIGIGIAVTVAPTRPLCVRFRARLILSLLNVQSGQAGRRRAGLLLRREELSQRKKEEQELGWTEDDYRLRSNLFVMT